MYTYYYCVDGSILHFKFPKVVQAHTLGEVRILGTVLIRVYSGTILPIFIQIGSYLTDKEQKISWHSFFETRNRIQRNKIQHVKILYMSGHVNISLTFNKQIMLTHSLHKAISDFVYPFTSPPVHHSQQASTENENSLVELHLRDVPYNGSITD